MNQAIGVKAVLKFQQIYSCHRCATKALGQAVTMELQPFHPGNLQWAIEREPLRAANMPVGWSNSYDTGFTCKNCTKKN